MHSKAFNQPVEMPATLCRKAKTMQNYVNSDRKLKSMFKIFPRENDKTKYGKFPNSSLCNVHEIQLSTLCAHGSEWNLQTRQSTLVTWKDLFNSLETGTLDALHSLLSSVFSWLLLYRGTFYGLRRHVQHPFSCRVHCTLLVRLSITYLYIFVI